MVWSADAEGMPGPAYHLLIARNVMRPTEVKFFVSKAPRKTAIETLLLVAFSRWHIERVFEDSKGEIGLDHFEARLFKSIQRHLVLSCLSHLFLAEFKRKHGGEKKLTVPQVRAATAELVPIWIRGGRPRQDLLGGLTPPRSPHAASPRDLAPPTLRSAANTPPTTGRRCVSL